MGTEEHARSFWTHHVGSMCEDGLRSNSCIASKPYDKSRRKLAAG